MKANKVVKEQKKKEVNCATVTQHREKRDKVLLTFHYKLTTTLNLSIISIELKIISENLVILSL